MARGSTSRLTTCQVPIAIAGSKLCAEAVLSDLSIPFPDTYTAQAAQPTSLLDKRHSRSAVYLAEEWFAELIPYILGAVLALLGVGGWAWYTDRLYPKHLFATSYANLGQGVFGADTPVAVLVLGLVAVSSVLYMGYRSA